MKIRVQGIGFGHDNGLYNDADDCGKGECNYIYEYYEAKKQLHIYFGFGYDKFKGEGEGAHQRDDDKELDVVGNIVFIMIGCVMSRCSH